MELVNSPAQFSSVFRDLLYSYAGITQGEVSEVRICDGSTFETLGIKRFTGMEEIDVNVSGYLRRKLRPMPVMSLGSGFHADAGRIVKCGVNHGEGFGLIKIFTASLTDLSAGDLLTLMPLHRDIGRGEKDEVSFVTEGGTCSAAFEVKGGGDVSFSAGEYTSAAGICTFVTDMEWVMSKVRERGGNPSLCRAVHVRISSGGSEAAHIIYVLKDYSPRAERLCWLNSKGGIDHFTFNTVLSRYMHSDKKRIISGEGYETVASSAGQFMELNSGYLPAAVTDALSEIVASSRVWACRDGGYVPVDIISDTAVSWADELACLRIKARESGIIDFQTF